MITSASNSRIKQVSALVRKSREREETGLFTAEGVRIFSEIPENLLKEVYVSESFEKENQAFLAGRDYETVSDSVFEKLCDTKSPQGILAVVKKPEADFRKMLSGNPLLVILEDLQDPGNLGTIFRTAEGAGASGIILSGKCADIYSPKCIRSTMGSVFRVPFVISDDLTETAEELKKAGIRVLAAHLKGKVSYTREDYRTGCAICIGNEGRGLSDALAGAASALVTIPMEGQLESLNAAVAAALLLYKAHEQRCEGEFIKRG